MDKGVVCQRCRARDWAKKCVKCGTKGVRWGAYGKFCQRCYGKAVPEGQQRALMEEAQEWLAARRTPKREVTGQEPALQLLLLPRNTEPLPA